MIKELLKYAQKGDIEGLRELLDDPERGFSEDNAAALDKRDEQGKSAMDFAAMLGRVDIIQELIERGADVNSATKNGTLL